MILYRNKLFQITLFNKVNYKYSIIYINFFKIIYQPYLGTNK